MAVRAGPRTVQVRSRSPSPTRLGLFRPSQPGHALRTGTVAVRGSIEMRPPVQGVRSRYAETGARTALSARNRSEPERADLSVRACGDLSTLADMSRLILHPWPASKGKEKK